jgi:hypothetical protein
MSEVELTRVEELEQQMENLKGPIRARELVGRLRANADFKELILEGFCKKDALRYLHLSEDPSLGEAQQRDALNMAQAAGHLLRFLTIVEMMGFQAEEAYKQMPDVIAAARDEEAEARNYE